jgi:hypothetical protein
MDSERQKRQKEIERLIQGTAPSREAESEFQEEIRKTASSIFEAETRKLQKTERPERPKRAINFATVGLWLIVGGVAGFVFWMPALGAVALLSGIAAIVWETFLKPDNKQRTGSRTIKGTSNDSSSRDRVK